MGLSCLFWLLFRCGTVDLPPHRSSYEGGSGHGQVEFPRLSLGLSFSRLPRTRADSLLARFLFLHHLTLPYLLFFFLFIAYLFVCTAVHRRLLVSCSYCLSLAHLIVCFNYCLPYTPTSRSYYYCSSFARIFGAHAFCHLTVRAVIESSPAPQRNEMSK
jgi:hypothetical protein